MGLLDRDLAPLLSIDMQNFIQRPIAYMKSLF